MPIRPENKLLYHHNWKQISEWIRGLGHCEQCGVHNYVVGHYDDRDDFVIFADDMQAAQDKALKQFGCEPTGLKLIKIVLTVAHLDHDPTNNNRENLKALCQRCHNRHDAAHRSGSRAVNKGQMRLVK